jgi:lactoylglutathione lyase
MDMTEKARTRITGVHTVGIGVRDQDRALEFYVGTLGLEKRRDVPFGDGRRWIEVGPAGAVTTIALVARQGDQHTGTGTGSDSGTDTGIRLATQDADAEHASMLAGGVDADDVLRWPGAPAMFAFRDPDGNTLEIVES